MKEPLSPYVDPEVVSELASDEDYTEAARSLLIKRRALKKAARKVTEAKKLTLIFLVLLLLLLTTCTASYIQEKMGNFTINLNRIDMYKQGISLCNTPDFAEPTARLEAETVRNATNITLSDLPEDIDQIDGQHNGEDYMAYTFYLKNAGKEAIDYYVTIPIDSKNKGVDDAVRVVVYSSEKDGRTVYAKRAKDGKPEPDTTPFYGKDIVINEKVTNFEVGDVHKYCVVIFLEGNDPECVDDIIGGMIRFSMNFNVADPLADR